MAYTGLGNSEIMFCVCPNPKDDLYHDLFVLKNCTGNSQSGCDSCDGFVVFLRFKQMLYGVHK